MQSRIVTAATGSRLRLAAALVLALGLPAMAVAQPLGLWSAFAGDGTLDASNGHLEIPSDPALNPTGAITIEAWIEADVPSPGQSCRSLVGKDYHQAYWVGYCNSGTGARLRSYTHGTSSLKDGGIIPNGTLVHVAVTSDGTTRNHYINGELVGTFAETGPPTLSAAPVEIGGDFSWGYSPHGIINEVRLWNVARTIDQIRSTINVPVHTAQPGLVAVWPMFTNHDVIGGHNGTFVGNLPPVLGPPATSSCGSSTSSGLCLQTHFFLNATFRTGAQGSASGNAQTVAVASPGSGIFWFFDPNNWEVMAKVINGCALNNEWWVFTAATTNVYYQLNVTNVLSGETKIYFNYPGPPAPAVTDTSAFPCS